jgi:GTP-binding protein LepA
MRIESIRNFCIIAHIDHGKSTLADRLLEKTNAIPPHKFREQFLDSKDIERERGITIKAKAIRLNYSQDGIDYKFNLIDTPGHADFAYEVSRSLSCCEGALLLVDATQGIQAQTVSHQYLADKQGLKIIPVINKIDLSTSKLEEVKEEIHQTFLFEDKEIMPISAKMGTGIDELFRVIIDKIPPPIGEPTGAFKALIFDSLYNEYRGVVVYMRVFDGEISAGQSIKMLATNKEFIVEEVGIFTPQMKPLHKISSGEVGYLVANIKDVKDVKIGDTICLVSEAENTKLFPGYEEPSSMVFCSFYPSGSTDFATLKKALDRLALNDSSFTYDTEKSEALGNGFRCGFLGLLHMDIIQERLEREEGVDLVQTAPNVTYEVIVKEKHLHKMVRIDNPADMPEEQNIIEVREPFVKTSIIAPSFSLGSIHTLCQQRRGEYVRTDYLSSSRIIIVYDMPFAEIIYDFYDKLKSLTHGYGTMDYQLTGFRAEDLVRLRIYVNGIEVGPLSAIVHRSKAERVGRQMLVTLRKEIPRHLFEVVLQAGIGKRIVARETIRAVMKNVTAKCYGGDITRKKKLWERQKEGKKRMKSVGSVEIPQTAFMAVLKREED